MNSHRILIVDEELTMRLSQRLLEQAELMIYDGVLREMLVGGTGS